MEYVGSGGKKANFAAILDGQGGQQKRQQSSEKDNPIPDIVTKERTMEEEQEKRRGVGESGDHGKRGHTKWVEDAKQIQWRREGDRGDQVEGEDGSRRVPLLQVSSSPSQELAMPAVSSQGEQQQQQREANTGGTHLEIRTKARRLISILK